MEEQDRVLFVEKELGRCFCTDVCIKEYFQPTVEQFEDQWRKRRPNFDIPELELSQYGHYRALTLEDPDEIWVEQAESGERHFSYISHFGVSDERFSYVVICLSIDGTPSFVFLSFPTKDEDLLDYYRWGQDMSLGSNSNLEMHVEKTDDLECAVQTSLEELRKTAPPICGTGELQKYESFVEPTLEDPDEIWTFKDRDHKEWCTFISRFSCEDEQIDLDEFIMIVICEKRTFKVVLSFPTTDPGLVQQFRKGLNLLNKSFGTGWTRSWAA